jgi:hypothetical protein
MLLFYILLVFLLVFIIIFIKESVYRRNNFREGFASEGFASEGVVNVIEGFADADADVKPYLEGFDDADSLQYTQPNKNDQAYATVTNTANITFLKKKMDELNGIPDRLAALEKQNADTNKALKGVSTQMVTNAVGGDPMILAQRTPPKGTPPFQPDP